MNKPRRYEASSSTGIFALVWGKRKLSLDDLRRLRDADVLLSERRYVDSAGRELTVADFLRHREARAERPWWQRLLFWLFRIQREFPPYLEVLDVQEKDGVASILWMEHP